MNHEQYKKLVLEHYIISDPRSSMFACIHVIMARPVMSSAEMSTKLASPVPIVHVVHHARITIQDFVAPMLRTQQITT